jgi:hypothetical protein
LRIVGGYEFYPSTCIDFYIFAIVALLVQHNCQYCRCGSPLHSAWIGHGKRPFCPRLPLHPHPSIPTRGAFFFLTPVFFLTLFCMRQRVIEWHTQQDSADNYGRIYIKCLRNERCVSVVYLFGFRFLNFFDLAFGFCIRYIDLANGYIVSCY